MRALGYECVKHVAGGRAAAHVILRKRQLAPHVPAGGGGGG
jgi:hypothetical protein